MNTLFAVGFLFVPVLITLSVVATGGMTMNMSTKDSIILLILSTAPCLAAFSGFLVGRSTNAFSVAPLRSRWRAAFIGLLGAACAIFSLPLGLVFFNNLQWRGVWQTIVVAVWFIASGMVLGYFYGPVFGRLAKVFPRLKQQDAYDRTL